MGWGGGGESVEIHAKGDNFCKYSTAGCEWKRKDFHKRKKKLAFPPAASAQQSGQEIRKFRCPCVCFAVSTRTRPITITKTFPIKAFFSPLCSSCKFHKAVFKNEAKQNKHSSELCMFYSQSIHKASTHNATAACWSSFSWALIKNEISFCKQHVSKRWKVPMLLSEETPGPPLNFRVLLVLLSAAWSVCCVLIEALNLCATDSKQEINTLWCGDKASEEAAVGYMRPRMNKDP